MNITNLNINNFRNIKELEIKPSEGINIIFGENAQGKTNLIEAIGYLSSARSHRARYDREMIMLGTENSTIKGNVFSRDREFCLEARLSRGKSRQLWSNGLRLKSAGDLSGILTTVLFCPEDLYLIREGSAARRKFLDSAKLGNHLEFAPFK